MKSIIKNIIKEELTKVQQWKKNKLIKKLDELNENNTQNYQWFEDDTTQWVIHIDKHVSPLILYYYIPWCTEFCDDYNMTRSEFSLILKDWAIHNVDSRVEKLQGDMSEVL